MDWQTDWGLRGRMALTMFLLFGLYVVFIGVLTVYFGDFLFPLIMLGGFSIAQYSSAIRWRCEAWAPAR